MSEAVPTAPASRVTALVVTADSGDSLHACVKGLLASPCIDAVRVADNASCDGVPTAVAASFAGDARFSLTVNPANLGFGAAMNRLARGCATPWLLLVNPDCRIEPEALSVLLALGEAHPDAGIIGACVEDDDGRVDPASCRRDPTLARVAASLGLRRGETVEATIDRAAEVQSIEAVSGALMLVRRVYFDALGGFDEGYFLHFEDLDLCRRMRDAGHAVLLAPHVSVRHYKGSSSRHRPVFVDWHKHRGLWRWLRTFDPAMRNPLLAACVRGAIWLHFAANVPRLLLRRTLHR